MNNLFISDNMIHLSDIFITIDVETHLARSDRGFDADGRFFENHSIKPKEKSANWRFFLFMQSFIFLIRIYLWPHGMGSFFLP